MLRKEYFVLAPSVSSYPGSIYQVDADHVVWLPSINCLKCGTWATTGIAYPSITDAHILHHISAIRDCPIPPNTWAKLVDPIRAELGDDRRLEPGTKFGPLEGEFNGRAMALMWVNPWTPLISDELYRRLKDRRIAVNIAPTCLIRGNPAPRIWDLEIWPKAHLSRKGYFNEPCQICGRIGEAAPEEIILLESGFDMAAPLQRIVELSTFIVASADFVDALRYFSDVDFTATPVRFATE